VLCSEQGEQGVPRVSMAFQPQSYRKLRGQQLPCAASGASPVLLPHLCAKPFLQNYEEEAGNLNKRALSLQTLSFDPQMLTRTSKARGDYPH